jgi:hypothetical protein
MEINRMSLTYSEGIALLTQDTGAVPCSRYGRNSEDCAPVAWRLCEIVADSNGEPIDADELEHAMGLVVNDHDDVAGLILDNTHVATDLDADTLAGVVESCKED